MQTFRKDPMLAPIAKAIGSTLSDRSRLLFFLDGDHSYETVRRELGEIRRDFPSASLLLHDTFFQSNESNYNTGPYRALQEFISEQAGYYASLVTATGLPGMTLLHRR